MKTTYETPEAKMIYLAAQIGIATLESLHPGLDTPTQTSQTDIDIPLQ